MQRIGCATTRTLLSGGTFVGAIWNSVTLSTFLSVAATCAQTVIARVREDGIRLVCTRVSNGEVDRGLVAVVVGK